MHKVLLLEKKILHAFSNIRNREAKSLKSIIFSQEFALASCDCQFARKKECNLYINNFTTCGANSYVLYLVISSIFL
jgi:hypothetical protein